MLLIVLVGAQKKWVESPRSTLGNVEMETLVNSFDNAPREFLSYAHFEGISKEPLRMLVS